MCACLRVVLLAAGDTSDTGYRPCRILRCNETVCILHRAVSRKPLQVVGCICLNASLCIWCVELTPWKIRLRNKDESQKKTKKPTLAHCHTQQDILWLEKLLPIPQLGSLNTSPLDLILFSRASASSGDGDPGGSPLMSTGVASVRANSPRTANHAMSRNLKLQAMHAKMQRPQNLILHKPEVRET